MLLASAGEKQLSVIVNDSPNVYMSASLKINTDKIEPFFPLDAICIDRPPCYVPHDVITILKLFLLFCQANSVSRPKAY